MAAWDKVLEGMRASDAEAVVRNLAWFGVVILNVT